jgi:alkanesulfonate monooxygenase SsuD/methylene tetrahydromethanopterin reductase-like flavin-dependent oxidoreductase (luciferase family)
MARTRRRMDFAWAQGMKVNLAYLCLFENPTAELSRAVTRQFVLVTEADRMGYDEIWIGEHHGDAAWPCASVSALLGFAAGVTKHARLGPATLLPAWHDAQRLAEDVATLDLLSKGRFNLAVSRGARWAAQRRDDDHAHLFASLTRIEHLLDGTTPGLVPRPSQARIPTWIGSKTPEVIARAATSGYGLMVAATARPAEVQARLALYRAAAPDQEPRLVLPRFAQAMETRDEALAVAQPYLQAFVTRMRALGLTPPDVEELLAMSLIGSYAEVAERLAKLQTEFGPHSIPIVPTSAQFDTVKRCLAAFMDEVRPLLPED